MGQEIERKFLVIGEDWRAQATGLLYCQGYIPTQGTATVRIRLAGEQGYITLKGPAVGLVRPEFEYPIPKADAQAMLEILCQPPLVQKYRYRLPLGNVVWEIDEFLGENRGLVMAEVELKSPDQAITLPPWIGAEVSDDPRYYNSSLARNPFSLWGR
ncbi:MAG: CYTH domain-containing protein [Leptolyngbyaceae cyanobacterium SM2_3_12]|nr:CYTH domain-containing protein [Leptolyngbyaceae cyanobacterium SM2_3_12]